MTKFPEPTDLGELRLISPVTVELKKGTILVRIFAMGGPHPSQWNEFRYFGPTAARFDHHLRHAGSSDSVASVQDRGVLYAATGGQAFTTCLAEVFQGKRAIDLAQHRRALAYFAVGVPLVLLDLTSTFATRIGASMAINSGPRPRARRWAQLLYEAYPFADGIYYASSMNANEPAVALFERAACAMPATPELLRSLTDPNLEPVVRQTASSLGYECL